MATGKAQRGFAYVLLLVVIAVLAVLASSSLRWVFGLPLARETSQRPANANVN